MCDWLAPSASTRVTRVVCAAGQALFHGATKEDLAGKGWIAAQVKAFTKWMNVYLRTRKLRVANIFEGLKDGVMLINLLEIISGRPLNRPWHRAPTMRIKMVLSLAVRVLP